MRKPRKRAIEKARIKRISNNPYSKGMCQRRCKDCYWGVGYCNYIARNKPYGF